MMQYSIFGINNVMESLPSDELMHAFGAIQGSTSDEQISVAECEMKLGSLVS